MTDTPRAHTGKTQNTIVTTLLIIVVLIIIDNNNNSNNNSSNNNNSSSNNNNSNSNSNNKEIRTRAASEDEKTHCACMPACMTTQQRERTSSVSCCSRCMTSTPLTNTPAGAQMVTVCSPWLSHVAGLLHARSAPNAVVPQHERVPH